MAEAVVSMGEVHTGLLRNSVPVSQSLAAQLLGFAIGERVRTFERPIPHAVSPELLTGVDCQLATSAGGRVRGVGTAVSRAAITGGHVVQGSAFVSVAPAAAERRLPWSHYLGRPGIVETIGRTTGLQVVDGFLGRNGGGGNRVPASRKPTIANGAAVLDLGSIGGRALDAVQDSAALNHDPPFKTRRTRLRWAVAPAGDTQAVTFRLDQDLVRSARLPYRQSEPGAVAALCEDLALHDWLLTTLLALTARAPIGSGDRTAVVQRLQPALDYLLHLWMPAARIESALLDLWAALEHRPGLSRQWDSTVQRIRDQVALAVVTRSLS